MKSIIFWDITPCSPSSLNRHFGGTYRLHLQGRINRFSKPASKQVAGLLNLFLWPWRLKGYVPPRRRLELSGLHGVISQKTILFFMIMFVVYDAVNISNYIASNGGGLANNELESICKGAIVTQSTYYPGMCLGGWRKPRRSSCPARDPNRAPPEYKCTAWPLHHPAQCTDDGD
jgi:hypothetical protein